MLHSCIWAAALQERLERRAGQTFAAKLTIASFRLDDEAAKSSSSRILRGHEVRAKNCHPRRYRSALPRMAVSSWLTFNIPSRQGQGDKDPLVFARSRSVSVDICCARNV